MMRNFLEEWLALLKGKSDKTYKIGNFEFSETTLVRVISGVCGVIVLYGVGLIAELMNNYNAYKESGGLVGGEMPPMKFAPYVVFANLLSSGGIKAVLFVAIAAIVIYVLVKYRDRLFGEGDYDERGFKVIKDGLYGTANWMSEKEAKEVLEIGSVNTVRGNILGEKDGRLYCLPVETRFNRHTMIIGASGTMKSRAIVRNHIFQAIRRGESVGITDPKGEMFTDCYELFKKYDYEVKVFNLVDPDHGNRWNCMSDLNGDELLTQMLTNVVIGNTSDGKGDQFWDNGERNLLNALILYVDNLEGVPPEEKSLAKVYEILTQNSERELYQIFEALPQTHPAKTPYNLFARADDKVKSGYVLGLGTRLQVLQVDAIKRLVSGNDIDLTMLGKKKSAIFVILPDQDATMQFISSLFFSLMFVKLSRYADSQPDKKCAVPVNLILDEFNNVGRIGGKEDGSDFARTLSVIRSRDVRITIAIQSLGQLQNRYPKNLWAELQGNCDIQIMLGCTDDITAEYISARSGEMTVQVDSTRRARKSFALFEVVPDYQQTEGKGKRTVMTKDEVLRLPPMEELVILRGYNLLKLKKWDFTNHPMSKEIRKVSIFDYYNDGVDYAAVEAKEAEDAAVREAKMEERKGTEEIVFIEPPENEPEVDSLEAYIWGDMMNSSQMYNDPSSNFNNPTDRVNPDDDAQVDVARETERLSVSAKKGEQSSEPEYKSQNHKNEGSNKAGGKKTPLWAQIASKTSEAAHQKNIERQGEVQKSEVTEEYDDVKVNKETGEVIEENLSKKSTNTQQENKPPKQRNPNRPGASARNPLTVASNSDDITGF